MARERERERKRKELSKSRLEGEEAKPGKKGRTTGKRKEKSISMHYALMGSA